MTAGGDAAPDAVIGDLIASAHHLAALGLSPGTSGNVSVRVGSEILVSATGAALAELDTDDLAVLDREGALVRGPRPTKEWPLHLALYRRSPEVSAVVHLHSPAAVAASCLPPHSHRSALPPVTPYFVMRVGQTPLVPYAHPGDRSQAEAVERHPVDFRALLLQNHGSVVTGASPAEAAARAVELESAADTVLRLAGLPAVFLDDAAAQDLARAYGSPWGGDSAP
ncbi:class II aldolase/adducin family protein [Microbacterium sp. T2.11-28]|uniref:class II aldolase/adducin family protein n=1 Tax=Microbacterium sp. T2.11-28 TaxID=3041169 RepID=UPI0024778589|nr:class II aldolase/adducin family protein [Microbacterium sp. T2.11-28]CAI9390759.1 3-oxo-tetronate 4-phosphate decarboxylase [Microbacterium sp. T2.11-28]